MSKVKGIKCFLFVTSMADFCWQAPFCPSPPSTEDASAFWKHDPDLHGLGMKLSVTFCFMSLDSKYTPVIEVCWKWIESNSHSRLDASFSCSGFVLLECNKLDISLTQLGISELQCWLSYKTSAVLRLSQPFPWIVDWLVFPGNYRLPSWADNW